MIVFIPCVEAERSVVNVIFDPIVIYVVVRMPIVLCMSNFAINPPVGKLMVPVITLISSFS